MSRCECRGECGYLYHYVSDDFCGRPKGKSAIFGVRLMNGRELDMCWTCVAHYVVEHHAGVPEHGPNFDELDIITRPPAHFDWRRFRQKWAERHERIRRSTESAVQPQPRRGWWYWSAWLGVDLAVVLVLLGLLWAVVS